MVVENYESVIYLKKDCSINFYASFINKKVILFTFICFYMSIIGLAEEVFHIYINIITVFLL